MKLNKHILAAAVAGVSLMAAASAQAAVTAIPFGAPGDGAASTGSDVILSVLDNVTGNSFTLDTGVTQYNFLTNAAALQTGQTITVGTLSNSSSDTGWQTFIGAAVSNGTLTTSTGGLAGDALTYELQSGIGKAGAAYNGVLVTQSLSSETQNGYSSSLVAYSDVSTALLSNGELGTATKINTYVSNVVDGYIKNLSNSTNVSSNANDTWSSNSADAWNATSFLAGTGRLQSGYAAAGIGQDAYAFYVTNQAPKSATVEGYFQLSLDGSNNATLTYTQGTASAVPVPAAAWMMLSGLVGVLSLNRRKKAV